MAWVTILSPGSSKQLSLTHGDCSIITTEVYKCTSQVSLCARGNGFFFHCRCNFEETTAAVGSVGCLAGVYTRIWLKCHPSGGATPQSKNSHEQISLSGYSTPPFKVPPPPILSSSPLFYGGGGV